MLTIAPIMHLYSVYFEQINTFINRRSLNPSVASVKSVYGNGNGCSHSATVFVESRLPQRKTTLLLAENELTGVILQVCNVTSFRVI